MQRLDEPTKTIARRGLAAARQALADARRRSELAALARHEEAMTALGRATRTAD